MRIIQEGPAVDDGYALLRPRTQQGAARPLMRHDEPDAEPLRLKLRPDELGTSEPARTENRAIAWAIAGHLLVAAAFIVRFTPAPPPLPTSAAMSVSYVVLPGDPPPGKPEGDDAPPPAKKADAKPAASAEKQSTEGDAPAAEDAPASEDPSPEQAELPSVPIPAEGDGTMALGARTRGDAQGLDPSLMASVGQAVATRIRACWTPPTAAPAGIAVKVVARYAPDGTLSAEPVVIVGEGPTEQVVEAPDGWQREAAEAVSRCSPLSLPPFLYPYWREVEIQIYSTTG